MSSLQSQTAVNFSPILLRFAPASSMNNDELFQFCRINRDYRIERTEKGELSIMTPAGGNTGWRNAKLTASLTNWSEEDGSGETFDSSTGFTLPNEAMRAPDASWVRRTQLAKLTSQQAEKFLPLCPDFVIELRSPTDGMKELRAKMTEYLENGTILGWLIDPATRNVEIYRPNQPVEILEDPDQISGDPELPGFVLKTARLWKPAF